LLKVLKISWLATPISSRARGRCSATNEPRAFQFFQPMISSAALSRKLASVCFWR
jgi:hypothetical protein